MDHFALKDDEMSIAYNEGRLNRNFMGYTVLPTETLLAFGASSISYINGAYFQNEKRLLEYYAKLKEGEMPLEKDCVLTKDDLIRKDLIQSIMCHFSLEKSSFSKKHNIQFEDYFGMRSSMSKNVLQKDCSSVKVIE